MKKTRRRPPRRLKPQTAKAARTPPAPPPKPGLPPADLTMLFELFHSEVDRTIRQGLNAAIKYAVELEKGGALSSYIESVREAAIDAVKEFAEADPFDAARMTELQRRIRDYLAPMSFLARTFQPFSRLNDRGDAVEFGDDLQTRGYGVDDQTTPNDGDSDLIDG